jgi:hypothetical protein
MTSLEMPFPGMKRRFDDVAILKNRSEGETNSKITVLAKLVVSSYGDSHKSNRKSYESSRWEGMVRRGTPKPVGELERSWQEAGSENILIEIHGGKFSSHTPEAAYDSQLTRVTPYARDQERVGWVAGIAVATTFHEALPTAKSRAMAHISCE